MIIKTKDDFQHPAGQIQLLDGRVLDCYPSEGPKCEVENELRLDTTGTYLVVGRQKKPIGEIDKSDDEKKELEKLFLDNAFVLLANKERILSDSRMFLCPLTFIGNHLAYTGTSGFRRPTFGIYLEFWEQCVNACIEENDGKRWLLYLIAGSPLSGSNRCAFVNQQGETKTFQVSPFKSVWPKFMEINSRYGKAKYEYDAYTLRQVLSILEEEGTK